jgi:dolichyl-phosphate beta-glucosyltransferase
MAQISGSEGRKPPVPGEPWLEIVVPARNEESRLPASLARLCAKAAELPGSVAIIVVDSASTDDTVGIVRRWPPGQVPVRLIRCTRPGKGVAVRAGLLASTAPYVGFCDADMAADLSAMDEAVKLLVDGRPLVLGSRAHPASVVEDRHSVFRKAGAAVFRAAARRIAPGVTDTQCGLKFFAGPVARAAAHNLRAQGFAFDIELIVRCRQLGAEPTEIPVRWQDVPGSTFSVWRHSLAAFIEVAAIRQAVRSPAAVPPELAKAAAEAVTSGEPGERARQWDGGEHQPARAADAGPVMPAGRALA